MIQRLCFYFIALSSQATSSTKCSNDLRLWARSHSVIFLLLCLLSSRASSTPAVQVSKSFRTLTAYSTAYQMQLDRVERQLAMRQKRIETTLPHRWDMVGSLLMVQHPHVYSKGSAAEADCGPFSTKDINGEELEFEIITADRGGQVTYHGPGQLVVYPILDLNFFGNDIHNYLRKLEDTVIQAMDKFGVTAARDKDHTGVWVGDKKLCAIGLKVTKWISYHGLAINVNPDMRYFDNIIPCGIRDKGVCCLKDFRSDVDMATVANSVVGSFESVFGVKCLFDEGRDSEHVSTHPDSRTSV